MRILILAVVLVAAGLPGSLQVGSRPAPAPAPSKGLRLADVTWPEAETVLGSDSIVVIPLGAGSKEHGMHLKLGNDLTLADYLTRRVLDATSVVVAPTVPYHINTAIV
jgi:hypothetical protein